MICILCSVSISVACAVSVARSLLLCIRDSFLSRCSTFSLSFLSADSLPYSTDWSNSSHDLRLHRKVLEVLLTPSIPFSLATFAAVTRIARGGNCRLDLPLTSRSRS